LLTVTRRQLWLAVGALESRPGRRGWWVFARNLAVTHALNDAKSMNMNTTIGPLEQAPADVREDGLLTPREAAQLLRVSVETLRVMPVPYLTIGAGQKRPRRRYVRQQLLSWCREQATR
jgi:hypothetical protein